MDHYEHCYDQASQLYSKEHEKNEKLETYVELLQTLCHLNGIEYPPLEAPIKF